MGPIRHQSPKSLLKASLSWGSDQRQYVFNFFENVHNSLFVQQKYPLYNIDRTFVKKMPLISGLNLFNPNNVVKKNVKAEMGLNLSIFLRKVSLTQIWKYR